MNQLQNLVWLDPNVILAGMFSTVIALLSVFVGAWVQRKRDREKEEADLSNQRTRLAKALHAELTALTDRYEYGIGQAIVAAKVWTDMGTATLSHDYFTVFDQNADKLGLFDDLDAKVIIEAYVIARGHADNVRGWSRRLDQMLQHKVSAALAQDEAVVTILDAHSQDEMPGLLSNLKEDRETLLKGFNVAQTALQKYF